jgi:hypothetical protein
MPAKTKANPPKTYKFIMIGAMYENGGNTTQRHMDGHPGMYVYPFESQPGSKYVNDYLSSMYPLKYRWPTFPSNFDAFQMYKAIIDEEGKVRARTPFVSKFRDWPMDMNDDERCKIFVKLLKGKELSRANVMEAFFRATFEAWKDFNHSGKEKVYVGYSPIIGVDGDQIIEDYGKKNGFVIHVVRNPWSAYADTKKRAVPLSLTHYMMGWVICQHTAMMFAEKYPENYFIIRYEDLLKSKKKAFGPVLKAVGLEFDDAMNYPSWNAEKMEQVYPWGTIRTPTEEVNIATANELSKEEKNEIYLRTKIVLPHLGYEEIWKQVKG